MAEVFVFGELCGAQNFPNGNNLFALYEFQHGSNWTIIQGERRGQTQTDTSLLQSQCVWSHPLDVHFATKGLPGWPKLSLQVWNQDAYGRCAIAGYAYVNIPTSPGRHELESLAWVPQAASGDSVRNFFLGGRAQLRSLDVVHTETDRLRLRTVTAGKVSLVMNVILRNFDKFGVEYY